MSAATDQQELFVVAPRVTLGEDRFEINGHYVEAWLEALFFGA